MTNFETKVKSFVEMQDLLDKAESIQLGRKDPDVYPFLSFIQSWCLFLILVLLKLGFIWFIFLYICNILQKSNPISQMTSQHG